MSKIALQQVELWILKQEKFLVPKHRALPTNEVEYHRQIQRQRKATEYRRTLSHGRGSGRSLLQASYFILKSLLIYLCLYASTTLLIFSFDTSAIAFPRFMLLLHPIGILAVLMILAFRPFNVRDLTYTYA
ncbi:hypothetical protein DVH24_023855 [Malus domestica]|uniref:Uncharacterized protein n=1 Tax=Malus domestica TaxID=3750 RepID=A0A498JLG9_MALDO|nr:hypothetical protein DVH24_023855 [Malus domestica]